MTKTEAHRQSARYVHWVVRQNRRQRSFFFALLALIFGVHLHDVQAPAWAWLLLIANFFVYPQVAYWHATLKPIRDRQRRIEWRYMLLDIFLYGLWMSTLGFPLWPTILLALGGTMSMVAYRGLPGALLMLIGLLPGVALGALLSHPFSLHVQTSIPVTAISIATLAVFLLMYARASYVRAYSLYEGRQQVRQQLEEIRALQDKLREAALRDPLTGLFNRRHFSEALPGLIERCARQQTPLSLVMIDVDHFKQVNDTHGHAAGDAVLVALAQLLLAHVRKVDLVCRMGGEEFVLVLENAPLQAARARAEMLRDRFFKLPMAYEDQPLHATLSCGLALYPEHGTDVDTLLRAADRALYAAKNNGRNRLEVATTEPREVVSARSDTRAEPADSPIRPVTPVPPARLQDGAA